MQSYSQELRDRVLRALARGEGPSAIAERFEVSRFYVYQVRDREQETGVRSSFQIGGHRRSRVQDAEPVLRRWIAAEPGLTLQELRERLAEQGIAIKVGALWHQLNKWNLTFKKTLHASEQEREDVQAARRAWTEAQPAMDLDQLVFIDETWAATNMTRSYGRAPKGCRCVDSALDGELFLAWIEQFLCPTLQPGDIVILDNLSSHKVDGVQQAVTLAGARVLYLPPYSPDLNPIEKLFAKLKTLLRKAALRATEELCTEIGVLINTITASECANYFASSGYVST